MANTQLTASQVIGYEEQAGFPSSALAGGLAVAQAESSLQTDPNPGAAHQGLFQIAATYVGQPAFTGLGSDLTDPLTNAQYAERLWQSGGQSFESNWGQWEVPVDAYKNNLSWAQDQVTQVLTGHGKAAAPPTPAPGTPTGGGVGANLATWFVLALVVIFIFTR